MADLTLIKNYTRPYTSEYMDPANPPQGWDTIPLSIRRVRLNGGGYDCHGEYFGLGSPLYHVQGENVVGFEINEHLRAMDRHDVCERVRRKYGKLVKFRT